MGHKKPLCSVLIVLTLMLSYPVFLVADEVDGPENIKLRATMPTQDSFIVTPDEDALSIDLVSARGKSIRVGGYTLASNRTGSSYQLKIYPGESGDEPAFCFSSETESAGQEAKLEYQLSIKSATEKGYSIEDAKNGVSKALGVRDADSKGGIIYETGDIYATIPNFDPTEFPTGWYASAIRFQVLVD